MYFDRTTNTGGLYKKKGGSRVCQAWQEGEKKGAPWESKSAEAAARGLHRYKLKGDYLKVASPAT